MVEEDIYSKNTELLPIVSSFCSVSFAYVIGDIVDVIDALIWIRIWHNLWMPLLESDC